MQRGTKIPSPAELIRRTEAAESPQVGAAVDRIVKEIESRGYRGGVVTANLVAGEMKMAHALEAAFRAAGWIASCVDSQHDAPFIRLTPAGPSPMDR